MKRYKNCGNSYLSTYTLKFSIVSLNMNHIISRYKYIPTNKVFPVNCQHFTSCANVSKAFRPVSNHNIFMNYAIRDEKIYNLLTTKIYSSTGLYVNVKNYKAINNIDQHQELKTKNKLTKNEKTQKAIEICLQDEKLDEASKIIKSTRKFVKHFFIRATVITQYINIFIKNKRLHDAIVFIQEEVNMPKDGRIYASSLIDLVIALEEQNSHKDAVELLENIDSSKILNDRRTKDFSRLLSYYVDKKDSSKLQGNA